MTRGDDANDDTPSATRMNAFRPWTIGVLIVLGLVAVTVLSMSAMAAESSTVHRECMGDAQHADHPEGMGTGCATGWIDTRVECSGSGSDYQCELKGRLGVDVEGIKTCGATRGDWFSDLASVCVTVLHAIEGSAQDVSDWETIATYTAGEIPDGGMTVVVPVETCVWADHTNVHEDAVRCSSFNHTERIPGDPAASGGAVDSLSTSVMSRVDHAVTTVENSDPPVSVSP